MPNGIVTYVQNMKRELERRGHLVSLFTTAEHAGTGPNVYGVRDRLWDRAKRRLLAWGFPGERSVFDLSETIAAAMLRVHRHRAIDVIEMEESFGWCADVAARTCIPLVVKLHGPAFLSLVGEELRTQFAVDKIEHEGRALRRSAAITAPSRTTLTQTIERYRLTPKHACHIKLPLALDEATPVWRLDACDRNTILFVGRFDLRKGADVMLRAFRLLLSERPVLRLIFIGPDNGLPAADGGRIPFLAYRDSLFPPEHRSRVEFRGPLASSEIVRARIGAMVTVVASRWENQPYALLEAMWQGCPVVSTDAGGCADSVVHGVTGWLARSEDPADFATQLAAVLADPQRAGMVGRAAREYVLREHSVARVVSDTVSLYQRVLKDV